MLMRVMFTFVYAPLSMLWILSREVFFVALSLFVFMPTRASVSRQREICKKVN